MIEMHWQSIRDCQLSVINSSVTNLISLFLCITYDCNVLKSLFIYIPLFLLLISVVFVLKWICCVHYHCIHILKNQFINCTVKSVRIHGIKRFIDKNLTHPLCIMIINIIIQAKIFLTCFSDLIWMNLYIKSFLKKTKKSDALFILRLKCPQAGFLGTMNKFCSKTCLTNREAIS